jgi:hemerythrin-like metal-binding protein
MEKIEHINWNPQYTVHVDALDREHQQLFKITNDLIDKYESGSDQCYDIIEELVNYLSEHFHAEQLVMMELNYPTYQNHMEAHKYFIDRVEGFLHGYRNHVENLTLNMLSFLRDWIFSHTTTFDLKYGEYLLKSQSKR